MDLSALSGVLPGILKKLQMQQGGQNLPQNFDANPLGRPSGGADMAAPNQGPDALLGQQPQLPGRTMAGSLSVGDMNGDPRSIQDMINRTSNPQMMGMGGNPLLRRFNQRGLY